MVDEREAKNQLQQELQLAAPLRPECGITRSYDGPSSPLNEAHLIIAEALHSPPRR